MRMGVVADDITGANDIGIMFTNGGCRVNVYTMLTDEHSYSDIGKIPADVIVLDTGSRLDSPSAAYQKVFCATRLLKENGCTQFFNKTCSVFRGNIGAEFDAMLDALGQDFAVIVLGFPKNGRITKDGIHYVHGKKLENSEFRNDPANPMTESNLVHILQKQTKRKVDLISYPTINQGPFELRKAIMEKRSKCNYLILDVLDQQHLTIIANSVKDEAIICGSSALGEELPIAWKFSSGIPAFAPVRIHADMGVLITAGSLTPQTAAQIKTMSDLGYPVFGLGQKELFPQDDRDGYSALIENISQKIRLGHDVILHSKNNPIDVDQIRQMGMKKGLTQVEISRKVSSVLAKITVGVLEQTGQKGLIVAGGETSAAVCQLLGVSGFRVGTEIEPGVPTCYSLEEPHRVFVLKSGSFGKSQFFLKSLEHLRTC